ncbi:MAG TPA: DUF2939 domain-containing protein [Alphaproteobacteria bacterium]|nr:DUF2939 domain-containing protein [Alphaproteobacteria bacterium]
MKTPAKIAVSAALLGLVAFYVASPYLAMERLYKGVMQMDAKVIETHVDFPMLRESLKEQANVYLAARVPKGQDGRTGIFGAASLVMLPKIVEAVVDAYVTPTGMRMALDRALVKIDGKDIQNKEPRPLSRKDIDHAFFENPDTFRIEAKGMTFILRLRDWRWKLTAAELPPEVFARRKAADATAPAAETTPQTAPESP